MFQRFVGDENSNEICYRSKSCNHIIPLKTSTTFTNICYYCNKLHISKLNSDNNEVIDKNKLNSPMQTSCSGEKNIVPESDSITLCESDNSDLCVILNNIFPDCSDNMKSFFLFPKQWLMKGIQMDAGGIKI